MVEIVESYIQEPDGGDANNAGSVSYWFCTIVANVYPHF